MILPMVKDFSSKKHSVFILSNSEPGKNTSMCVKANGTMDF